jgi:hypothetical protein
MKLTEIFIAGYHCYQLIKNVTNIHLSRLSPHKFFGDHLHGFKRNRSIADHAFSIRQILEKKWEYIETVHQLFIDFKKAYDSVTPETS